MKIIPIQTPIVVPNDNLIKIITNSIPRLKDRDILVITSKIVAMCQGRIANRLSADKEELIKQEADYYLPADYSVYDYHFTIKNNTLVAAAGIDESNGKDIYILWPNNLQATTNSLRSKLKQYYGINRLGIIISDSVSQPLRRGTTGVAISYSGFKALKDYRGKSDLYDQKINVTQANIAGGLAAAAVVAMGEGKEQTPLCVIQDVPFVDFVSTDPNPNELSEYYTSIEDDLFSPFLKSQSWHSAS